MHFQSVNPLPPGAKLLEYLILNPIGQGGFGTTYRCRDVLLNKDFAIKEYTPHFLVDRQNNGFLKPKNAGFASIFNEGRESFLLEARSLAKFSHQNIVPVTRFFEANNTAYFVMEYQEGGSLRQLMRDKHGQFTESEIRALIAPLCSAIAELHAAHIIHRDVKPDNIIMGKGGTPTIIDFGAAVSIIGLNKDMLEIISTPGYAPPEQITPGAPQGAWVDIYALGATLYELISGICLPPSQERMAGKPYSKAINAGRGQYSTQLLEIVDLCIDLDYRRRPQSINYLLNLLAPPADKMCRKIVGYISQQMLTHFINFATPNLDVRVNELVTFFLTFPVIDLAWRINSSMPSKDVLSKLLSAIPESLCSESVSILVDSGFCNVDGRLLMTSLAGRIEEYSAAYLLDRTEEHWEYKLLCRQAARKCLTPAANADLKPFSELLEDVVDRARGRIKKAFHREIGPIGFEFNGSTWSSFEL